MQKMTSLVTWIQINLLVNGDRIQSLAHERIESRDLPIEQLVLRFTDGELVVEGKARVGIGVPFRFVVRRIETAERILRIFIEDLSAFGFLPVPRMLLQFAESRLAEEEGISLSSSSLTIQIAIDRFLPKGLNLTIDQANIVARGIELRLGPGAFDLPPDTPGVKP